MAPSTSLVEVQPGTALYLAGDQHERAAQAGMPNEEIAEHLVGEPRGAGGGTSGGPAPATTSVFVWTSLFPCVPVMLPGQVRLYRMTRRPAGPVTFFAWRRPEEPQVTKGESGP
ncbi:hypothetical protein [Nocardiopsis salina]|uniref:hypothetical protein n=1 Tax=Nocardiopsis salina TaxID=245836 RepID=UPI000348C5F2|nr:hypothetical protein [Nocardiopsis salina]